ncbi:alpha/beta fold hydrolase [Nocardiopsis sp. L17-MgMaSL7]|uniref:alpha/beta fold hydrolase n=1 Tax=Nocardiopsis sp. L17-MgMaSL7 TaxID=1938893 RepID=UPI000D717CA0|nr:alpha/beta hydrolase [Nocardiopsis sp. L17-MgMaSL7]PWV58090.1 pimeloyl-ACP methyl ester carboxylesterase [Nocardiopsis sp. L17-MgMaSL7]
MSQVNLRTRLGTRHTVDTPIGRIHYYERGQGPVLVFVHGVIANADLWNEVVPRLADSHRCVTLDLPLGSHSEPAAPGADLSPGSIAAVVAETLAQVAPQGCVLVGNDSGGVISQLVAVQAPERLNGLVLTSCDAFDNFLPWALRYTQLLARIPGGVWVMTQALRLPPVRALPLAFGWLTKQPVPAAVWRSFLEPSRSRSGIRRDLGKFLRGISTKYTRRTAVELRRFDRPALLAWADTSRIFPIEHAHRLAERMPDAVVRPISDSYALVPLDQPESLAREVRSFVADRIPND